MIKDLEMGLVTVSGPNLITWVLESEEPFPAVLSGRRDLGRRVGDMQL